MRNIILFTLALALTLFISAAAVAQKKEPAQNRAKPNYPPQMPEAQAEVYKSIGDTQLQLYIFEPQGHKPSDKTPAIVFFFGGGWSGGSPAQFHEQCKYLASRGMVAIAADYRVATRHKSNASQSVADAKSAIRWVRQNAGKLGIDPNRVAAGGGSAGGHLAACTGVIKEFDESTEDASISSVPNAMVLFNPAVVLASIDGESPLDPERAGNLKERMGTDPINLSPYHHVAAGAPPTILFHGKADTTVPYRTAEQFTQAMTKAGNKCTLMGYDGEAHGFFNFGRGGNRCYVDTVRSMDEFLTSLGYLEGKPTIKTDGE